MPYIDTGRISLFFEDAGSRGVPVLLLHELEMIAVVEDALRNVDVLLCASAMDPPSRLDDPVETERTYPRQARTPFNVTGHPALAMMAGLSSSGLPLSV